MQVWKFPIQVDDNVMLAMPGGAVPLHVETQNGVPCLWALVNPSNPARHHHFKIRGTGHEIGADVGEHVGSFMLHGGALVFHLFKATE